MKQLKQKKCRVCKALFNPFRSTQVVCNYLCAQLYADELNRKKELKDWKIKKAKMKVELMTLQDYIKIAQQVFNKYIRERDKNLLCISCQKKPLKQNAGHFYNANNHWSVRFDERNVHLQCEHCNTYLSGNLIYYRENLIKKIGLDEFEKLSVKAKETRKYSKEELKEIIEVYRNKLKA